MDPIRTYEYLLVARERVLDKLRQLSEAQYARQFPIGPGTLGKTLTHIMISEWYYIERMEKREVPPYQQWPIRDENPPPFQALEAKWAEQARGTRAALSTARDWDAPIEYEVTTDDGRDLIVTATASGLFTQLVLHEVHHRAQVLNMLRQLGIECGELDFNWMMFQRREIKRS